MTLRYRQRTGTCRRTTYRLLLVIVLSLFALSATRGQTIPMEEAVQAEIEDFQDYFRSRFPGVALEVYANGVNALPQNIRQAPIRDLLLAAPPFDDELEAGRVAWQAPMPSGLSLADCFTGKPPPTAYPYYFNGEAHTITGDINLCRSQNGAKPLAQTGAEMARLVMAFKAPWRGLPMDVDFREDEIRRLFAVGRQAFWAKRGQMNLSCANCHVHNAGNRLRGQVLSAALGHGSGYPAYSIRWREGGNPMGTLYRRYDRCFALAGAAPLPADGEIYQGLEVYQAILNRGIPLGAPSIRP